MFLGCKTGRISTLEKNPDEAILFGKVTFMSNGEVFTRKHAILFDEIWWGTYAVFPDDSNYIYTKVPVGKHFIARVESYPDNTNFPETFLTFETNKSGIYYIGDITIDWDNISSFKLLGGLLGSATDAMKGKVQLPVHIVDNFEETTKYITKKIFYQTNLTIEKSIVKIKISE
jgi:hypothetical protein